MNISVNLFPRGNMMKRMMMFTGIVMLLILQACGSQAPLTTAGPDYAVSQADAKRIAVNVLISRKVDNQYILGNAEVSDPGGSDWHVYFKHLEWQTRNPGRCLVTVNKSSGASTWKEVR